MQEELAQLREQNLILRQLLDAISTPVFSKDLQGLYHDCNAGFEDFFGLTRQELQGKTVDSLFEADVAELHRRIDRELLQQPGRRVYETSIRHRDGTCHDVLVDKAPSRDSQGRVTGIVGCLLDITALKKAGEALRQSEEKYRKIFENAVIGIFQTSPEGRILNMNPAMARMFGYDSPQEIMAVIQDIGRELYVNPEDRERLLGLLREHGQVDNFEVEMKRRDKSRFRMSLNIHTVCDPTGRILYLEGTNLDVTRREQAEEALKESDRHLAEILDFIPDATMVIDCRGRITAWNRAMEEMTGVPAERMVGKEDHEYALPFYGQRRPMLIDIVLQRKSEAESYYTFLERRDDLIIAEATVPCLRGKQRFLSGWAHPIYNTSGEIVGAIECIRDITEKHQAQEALAESESRFRLLTENASDIIFTMSPRLHFTYVSPSVERIRGFSVAEAMQQSLAEVLTPASLQEAMKIFREESELIKSGFRGRRRTRSMELEEVCKDGSTIWTETVITSLWDADRNLIEFIGITRDISQRKRAEAENKRLEAQLMQAQKMESIGTLAGGIAHDFNNILSAVFGFSELAKLKLSRGETVEKELNEVIKAGMRARDLVTQILTFSRKADIQRAPLELTPLVKETVKFIRASLPATIEIRLELEAAESTVLADPTQIHQILMNLCTNAAQAMRAQGGLLTIRLGELQLEADGAAVERKDLEPGPYLQLSVDDNGQGIPADILDKIFDPFFTTKARGEGTGMGLSVVHGIVKDMHGAVTVTSELGKGSSFCILLPRLSEARVAQPSDAVKVAVSGPGQGRILLVDDEEGLLQVGRGILEQFGYQVAVSSRPLEAIEIFKAGPDRFDCVLTDMTMPKLTGLSLCERLKQIRADIPVVLCSGFSPGLDEAMLKQAGVSELVMKPMIASDLVEAINRAIHPAGS